MESTSQTQVIVLDLGSSTTKAGFAGEEVPRCEFHSAIRNSNKAESKNQITPFIRNNQSLSYPIQDGQIKDFDKFEKLLEVAFHKMLKTDP